MDIKFGVHVPKVTENV